MAGEKFHFSSDEIFMKKVFLIFLFGGKDIVHDGNVFCLKKKVGKGNMKFRCSGTLRDTLHLKTTF